MRSTISFSKQRQSSSLMEANSQSSKGISFGNPLLVQSGVLPSTIADIRISSAGGFSTLMTSQSEDDGIGSYLKGAYANRQKICESAQEKFLELARSEYFEYGYTPPSERHILSFAKDYPGLIGEVVQNTYLAESEDTGVMLALLNAVASLSYETIYPYGQTLALAALSNKVAEVKEAAIRVYETWGHRDGARILANVECQPDWLEDYRKQVIFDLGGIE